MKKSAIIFIWAFLLFVDQYSQENKFDFSLNGFVKTDFMLDTRQTVTAREGHFLLYPENKAFDNNNIDYNDNLNLNILSIQSRITGLITAPDALGAKVSGILEGAFFGHSNSDVNGFRLRHAFVKLNWEKHSLIIGQYWHPFFITEVYPLTVSFNTGVPFQPFSRNPQIRYTYKPTKLSFSFTASSQRDFTSIGPNGISSDYLRNSALPMLNFNVQYNLENFITGFGIDYKSLLPERITELSFKTDEKINSLSFLLYGKYKYENLVLLAEGFLGENSYDLLMLGGYGVKTINIVNGKKTFTNLKIFSTWADISYGTHWQLGLFVGYTKNNGSDDKITGDYYTRGKNIDKVYRVSPRLVLTEGKLKFATEIEYTSAYYGLNDEYGLVKSNEPISNVRLLLSSMLFF